MNININKSVNKQLKEDELNINIEFPENYNEMDNIIEYIQAFDKRKMNVYDGYNMIQINVDDIMYFYSDGNYNFCKTKDKEYRVKSKLYEIDKMSNDFIRISKGCIINIKQVKHLLFILYILSVILQILYDKSLVNKLNNKLKKTKERGELL